MAEIAHYFFSNIIRLVIIFHGDRKFTPFIKIHHFRRIITSRNNKVNVVFVFTAREYGHLFSGAFFLHVAVRALVSHLLLLLLLPAVARAAANRRS